MRKNKIFQRNRLARTRKLALLEQQLLLMKQHFPFLSCSIKNRVLVCVGWITSLDFNDRYRVKIEYVVGHEPKTTILKPLIVPHKHIHMYRDRSVCLHYPPDMPWNERLPIFQFTIPWISEWILFYEIYQLSGKWEGRESPAHIRESDKNINQDYDKD